jgi:hypothetical protein
VAQQDAGPPRVLHDTPGVEVTTGPLGQGIANAVGMAMAEQFLAARFNKPGHTLFDHKVWVIASDGDLMEGVSAEAASMAGHLKLGKIIAYWDDNSITIDGRTDISFKEDVLARYRAYGWHTESVDDGEDIDAILAASRKAEADPRPSLIRVKTIIGFPAPTKKDSPAAHGAPLGAAEIKATKAIMGWPEEPFHVPAELGAARDAAVAAGAKHKAAWDAQLAAYREAFPELAAQLDVALAQGLPAGWDGTCPSSSPAPKGVATRKASATVLNALAKAIPHLVGGSADLAGSNGSELSGLPFYGRVGRGRGAAQHQLRGARARHGLGPQRHGAARRHDPLRRHVPHLRRLHAPHHAPRRAHEAAHALHPHARQHRPRRGRPHAPAGGAAVHHARHPGLRHVPPRRRQRDARVLEGRAAVGRPGGAGAHAPGHPHHGP